MLTRTITALIALAVFAAVIAIGNPVFSIAMAAIILFMIYESSNAVAKSKTVKISGFVTGALILGGIYLNRLDLALVLAILAAMVMIVLIHGSTKYTEMFSMQFMAVYIALFMSYIPKMFTEMGFPAMFLVFVIAWGSDTAAYFCGTFFGKHKLIPKVSPKKTVEGSLGAVICAALLCMAYVYVLSKFGYTFTDTAPTGETYLKFAIIGLVTSVLSQFGDLSASAIKRDAEIKDYGWIFPGHGGFMDRFDSVVFIAPIVYYLCVYLIK